jgi:thiamine-monophosphate kinase
MNENSLLAVLRETMRRDDPSVLVGSGPDDCAHLLADGRLAVTVDAVVEGVHFDASATAEQVARKAILSALSDLAASGCRSRWVVAALGLRAGLPEDWGIRFAAAFALAAEEEETTVAGGDVTSSPGGTFVSVTAIGEPFPGGPVLRSGAKPGNVVLATGELGGSLLGRHLSPKPRFREMEDILAFSLRRRGDGGAVAAAMDISDGLALDLTRLCRESGVGAVVHGNSAPISPDARRLAERSGKTPLRHALADGEDFELLLCVDPEDWREYEKLPRPGLAPLTRIGEIVAGRECVLVGEDGIQTPLAPEGYEHSW